MAEVTLKKVVKAFGKTEVIHGISTRIRDGEFVVIVGPSGCGKSTLLRLIAGLEEVSAGDIAIGGRVVNELEPKDRDIAMVFQNYALYPHMSVFDNMAYGLKLRRVSREEIRRRVEQTAVLLQLEGLLERKPRQLSGGQRQRVAMGRCIVRKPEVFLFDEPLSNLDAKLRVQMRLELRNLHETLNVTSVYVTHDQVEAMTLGDRLIVMKDGYAEQIGTPLEVYEYPATRFVAGFIGSPAMNFMEARIDDGGGAIRLSDGTCVALDAAVGRQTAARDVVLGIRPEHIGLGTATESPLTLKVSSSEILGADTLVYGHLAQTGAFITVRLPDVHHVEKNASIPLVVKPEKIHLFNADSGHRISETDP